MIKNFYQLLTRYKLSWTLKFRLIPLKLYFYFLESLAISDFINYN